MITAIVNTLFLLLFIYLCVNVGYLLFCAIAGNIRRSTKIPPAAAFSNIAVLITSYREDSIIVNTVSSAVQHDYPSQHFRVFVAADHLSQQTIAELQKTGAEIHALHFEVGSKAKSLNFLLNHIDENNFDIALILDGDNIMQQGLLHEVNNAFQNGLHVVQVHRTAKNTQTPVAVLDALSEEVNNHLFRLAPNNMNLSSSLIGSGMAFPFKLLKKIYNKPGILGNPACDREVDFEMLVAGEKVTYLDHIKLLDEKVSKTRVYRNQRRRWMESQLMHVKLFFSDWKRVHKKGGDFWHKLFINLIPPRLLLIALFLLATCACIFQLLSHNKIAGVSVTAWLLLFIAYIFSIIISIPARFYNAKTLKAFLHLPGIFISFLTAAFTVKDKRKEFVHTPKSFTGSASTKNEQ